MRDAVDHDELARTQPIPRRGSLAALAATLPDDYLWYPGADREPLSVNIGGELRATRGLVLHVQQGKGDLFGWFSRASAQVSAHFWVSKTGRVVQYIPTVRKAWAQRSGNDAWLSAETEGYDHEPLTDEQITALRGIYTWGAAHFGWPRQLADSPTGRGLGWHGMGGQDWGAHPDCPGDLRKAQRIQIIAPTEEDDMPTPAQYARAVLDLIWQEMQVPPRGAPADWHGPHEAGPPAVWRRSYEQDGNAISRLAAIAAALQAAMPEHAHLLTAAAALPPDIDRAVPRPQPLDVAIGALAAITDQQELAWLASEVHQRAATLAAPSPIPTTPEPS
jgi:hypothetical protein